MKELTKDELQRLITQSEQSAQRAQICQALLSHGFQYQHNEGLWMTFTRRDFIIRQDMGEGWAIWAENRQGKPTHSGRGCENLLKVLVRVGL